MRLRTRLTFCIALINAGLALPAFAQKVAAPAKEASGLLEEIVVTATKRETNLMETPIAITVLGEDKLRREGIANIKDLPKLVPNMDMAFDSSQSAPVITLRGVRSTNITELGDPAIGLHLDGIYSPRPQGAMALMFDVERVEIQRGPQGTLFGRNSTVGNINIISKRPQMEEFEANIGVELGNWNHQQVRGMINIPVSTTFGLRGSFMTEQRDSYLTGYYDPNQWDQRYLPDEVRNAPLYTGAPADRSLTQRERWWGPAQQIVAADSSDFYNNSDQYSFRISGLWEPTDDLSWLLTYEKFQDSSAGTADTINCGLADKRIATDANGNYLDASGNISATPVTGLRGCDYFYGPGADEYTVNVGVPGKVDLSIENIRSNLLWHFSDSLDLVYNAGWSKQARTQISDQDRGVTSWDMSIFFNDSSFISHSHELQIQSTNDSRLKWVAGLFIFEESNDMQGGWMNFAASADYWNQPERTLASQAAFLQGTYELTDNLGLTLGYRRTRDTKEDVGGHNMECNDSNPNQLSQSANPGLNGVGRCFPSWDWSAYNALPQDYFWNSAIYTIANDNDIKYEESYNNFRVGLDYKISPETMVFGYIANGNKSGGIGDVFIQQAQDPLTAQYLLDENGQQIVVKRWENTYDTEEVVTYELGVKADLFDDHLRLMTSVFYSDYTDMQRAAPKILFPIYSAEKDANDVPTGNIITDGKSVFQTDNIGEAAITGLELEFDWTPYANGRINGHFTWLKTEITSDFMQQWDFATTDLFAISPAEASNPTNASLTTNLKGNELPASPEFTLNINYSHAFVFDFGGTLLPWISVNWRDESYYSIFNTDKHEARFATETPDAYSDTRPAVTTVNLGVKYSAPDDQWNLEAFVNNATDEVDYYWAGGDDGVVRGPISMPMFYGVRANYNF